MFKSAVILACVLASALYAQPRCSFGTIQGSYATSCQGFMDLQTLNPSSPAGTLVPFANLGKLTVDPDGIATLTVTLNVAGTVAALPISDVKITISEDCTGEMQYKVKMASGESMVVKHLLMASEDGSTIRTLPVTKAPSLCSIDRLGDPTIHPSTVLETTEAAASKVPKAK